MGIALAILIGTGTGAWLDAVESPEAGQAAARDELTPLVGGVLESPVPFSGSDRKIHLDYELELTNATSGEATIERLAVIDPKADRVVHRLDAEAVARRLQPIGSREPAPSLGSGTAALLFLDLRFGRRSAVPERLVHRLAVRAEAAPPGQRVIRERIRPATVSSRRVATFGPPLEGTRYLAADSCCRSSRHRRAALPVDGQLRLAQRFAVDWEQLDREGRIYNGPREDLESYEIFGEKALAVADARVVSAVDGEPEQTPGEFPSGITLDQADGNHVVLDLGGGNYALYAHFQPGTIRVEEGERVRRGQVLALVGNSGNSIAPHLHFHVMGGPSPLASNGLPYAIDSQTVLGQAPGTEAFDQAEANGTPLEIERFRPPARVRDALPMDQTLVRFR